MLFLRSDAKAAKAAVRYRRRSLSPSSLPVAVAANATTNQWMQSASDASLEDISTNNCYPHMKVKAIIIIITILITKGI